MKMLRPIIEKRQFSDGTDVFVGYLDHLESVTYEGPDEQEVREVLGEAAENLSPRFQDRIPDVEAYEPYVWRQMVASPITLHQDLLVRRVVTDRSNLVAGTTGEL